MVRSEVMLVLAASASLLLNGCGSAGDANTTDTTTPSTTTGTTMPGSTTTGLSALCESGALVPDTRPDAQGLARRASDKDECCATCHADEKCVSWHFFSGEKACKHTLNNATWGGMIYAKQYVTGTKKVGQCADCDDCGNNEKAPHLNFDCSICSRGEKWNHYPCFVPDACRCGGAHVTTTTTTSTMSPCTDCAGACWVIRNNTGECKTWARPLCMAEPGAKWCKSSTDAVTV